MRRTKVGVAAGAVLTGLFVVPTTGTAAGAGCTATPLPDPPGGTVYAVTGTDDKGTYVGQATDQDGTRFGVVWRDGGVERLERLLPADINGAGLMAGHVEDPDVVPPATRNRAAVQQLGGELERLPPAAAPNRDALQYSSAALELNEAGDVVGIVSAQFPTGVVASAWTGPDHAWVELTWDRYSAAEGVDDSGLVISQASTIEPAYGGMVWRADGTVVREFGPYADADPRIDLFAIDDGTVAATRTAPGGAAEVVLVDAATGTVTPVPGATGTPADIAGGVVVGAGPNGPMLWRGGESLALPATGDRAEVTVVDAAGTEAAGIVGDEGATHATLWRC